MLKKSTHLPDKPFVLSLSGLTAWVKLMPYRWRLKTYCKSVNNYELISPEISWDSIMAKQSAGILLFRRRDAAIEVFLVHPGGPFWAKKDDGVWSLPKGEISPGEDALAAARREFQEETGFTLEGPMDPLTPVKQPSGKIIHAWVKEGDCDALAVRSNTFVMEWPPRSGRKQEFPEIDRAGWFSISEALIKIGQGQIPFLLELQRLIQDGIL